MNPGEYEAMARAEDGHWWYQALRDLLQRLLTLEQWELPASPRILDAGCGTGANLALMSRLFQPAYLGGFDTAPEALQRAAERVPQADLYPGDVCDPEVHVESLDLLLSLDVIYIPGTELAMPGLRRLVQALRPGGLLVLNLPAYDWLYSRHDVAIHTRERYTRGSVLALLERLGLRPERLTYRLCWLFPLVLARRLPDKLRARRGDRQTRSDLHRLPGAWTNRTLLAVMRAENRRIAGGGAMPWGSSVFAVARKL